MPGDDLLLLFASPLLSGLFARFTQNLATPHIMDYRRYRADLAARFPQTMKFPDVHGSYANSLTVGGNALANKVTCDTVATLQCFLLDS
jgi:hypothetical protein